MKHVRRVAVGLLLTLSVTVAPLRGQKLGTIDFPTSATGDAQAAFVRGVLFMHSFEYEDAAEAFRAAQAAEPDFAMAYWGEALSYNHPVWQQQDADAARAALAQPVIERNADHPGAVHYTIHSFDDPIHTPLGLAAARAYSEVAPEAGPSAAVVAELGSLADGQSTPDQAEEALGVFQESLDRTPARTSSLLGLAKAAAATGDGVRLGEVRGRLEAIWHAADPGLREARGLDKLASRERP